MDDVTYSDRVWTTLLWEFTQHVRERMQDVKYVKQTVHDTSKFMPREWQERGIPELVEITAPHTISIFAGELFIGFVRKHAALFDPEHLLAFAREHQAGYPQVDLKCLVDDQAR